MRPYQNSITKRLVKTPKLYFMDVGLTCYLTKWPNSETLESGFIDRAILKTYVVSEIIKSYLNSDKRPNLYYYQDIERKELAY